MKKLKKKEEAAKLKRDTTPMPSYYKNWDKVAEDLEKELEGDDYAGDIIKARNPVFKENVP